MRSACMKNHFLQLDKIYLVVNRNNLQSYVVGLIFKMAFAIPEIAVTPVLQVFGVGRFNGLDADTGRHQPTHQIKIAAAKPEVVVNSVL